MPTHHRFSCYLIGEETLLIQCAEVLLAKGHLIYGVVSPDKIVEDWAKEHNLPFIKPHENIMAFMQQQPFEYLFSIINSTILPPELLNLPRHFAINYHDSPLPRYGGNYATSWAIINQETHHAISWHVMVNKVDAGDILQQWPVDITPHDTALSLNLKCYDAAIQAFTRLTDDLAYQRVIRQPQDLTQRTFFNLYKRPAQGGVISWQHPAEQSYALWRGLQFGMYRNELTTPKLFLADADLQGFENMAGLKTGPFFIITQMSLTPALTSAPAGTVVQFSQQNLTIATPSQWIIISQLTTLTGQAVPLSQLPLRRGQQLPELSTERATSLEQKVSQLSRHESYWLKQLSHVEPLTIPYAQPVTTASKPEFKTVELAIPTTIHETITTNYDATPFYVAAFITYLARLTRQHAFDVGFELEDFRAWDTFFAPQVPLKISFPITWTFTEIYAAIQAQLNEISAKQSYAHDVSARYPQLVYRRELSQTWPIIIQQLDKPAPITATQAEFMIQITPQRVSWHYNTTQFETSHIIEMQQQFINILHHLTSKDATETFFWNLPLLTESEKQQILVEWNNTAVDYPLKHLCIHHLFERQAAQTPEAIALVMPQSNGLEADTLTYQQLNAQANQLAHYLQKLGVGPEMCVGVCMERSLELIVAVLGVLKAGGAYVPLNPQLPAERLAFMVKDVAAPWIITQKKLKGNLPPHLAQVIYIDNDWPLIAQEENTNPVTLVKPDNLVYVIYTSGSTGQAKGVMIEHRALVNFTCAMQNIYHITPRDRVLQFATLSFDASVEEIYLTLSHGATLFLRSDELIDAPRVFWQKCHQWQLTILDLPTAYWHELAIAEPQPPESLRLVIIGGEKVQYSPLATWFAQVPTTIQLINTYGPTETAVVAIACDLTQLRQDMPHDFHALSMIIGRPIGNMQAYILDTYLQPVPIGVTGELYLSGANMGRGYLNRPELTKRQFITNIFNQTPFYRTGDLARYKTDGHIEFMGRIDNQVKLRGFRIELAEIEIILSRHEDIEQAIVLAKENNPRGKFLVAYLVSKKTPAPSTRDLRNYLATKLPDYMIPAMFITLDTLPLTYNGKVDLKALPSTQSITSTLHTVAPQTVMEKQLANLWGEIFGQQTINIHDNFFELGGDSLQSARLVAKISDSLQCPISIKDIFLYPTIATLAHQIEQLSQITPPIPSRGFSMESRIANSPLWQLEERPLLSLFALGQLPPVEAAAIGYLSDLHPILRDLGVSPQAFLAQFCHGLPIWTDVVETHFGRIAFIFLPVFETDMYSNQPHLVELLLQALKMAYKIGAKVVSLTGLIPSATNYGQAILAATNNHDDLPIISTGHATTVSAVVLNVEATLQRSQRKIAHEIMGFLGLGSIGRTVLQLMLKVLPHPKKIILCDTYDKQGLLQDLKTELRSNFGFMGDVSLLISNQTVPRDFYQSTTIIGATNVPDILDMAEIHPGTILIDDSAPHCFNPYQAIQRLETYKDILFTEGGFLKSPQPIHGLQYIPSNTHQYLNKAQLEQFFLPHDSHQLTGCILSSLLSAHFPQLEPIIGLVEVEKAVKQYYMLKELGFTGANMQCENYIIAESFIKSFQDMFGDNN